MFEPFDLMVWSFLEGYTINPKLSKFTRKKGAVFRMFIERTIKYAVVTSY